MERIIIFDTTLRDGEQSAGASLNLGEKLEIAKYLEALRVDVIEAGFPISSKGDFNAVQSIAREIKDSIVCPLAHANPQAIDAAWEAIKEAKHPRIHVFLSSSDVHLLHALKKSRDEVLQIARTMVARAKSYCDDIEFSPMDATRTSPEYLYRVLETVIEAGATTVNIPDTVGYTMPQEFSNLIDGIKNNVPNIDKAILSVHCHDDLGLAVANTLAVINHGVRQVECTINGVGERAGNAALEEIVMALQTRKDLMPFTTNIDTRQLYRTSRLVSDLIGMPVQPNKAIVGANAFRHQSGIHQDGILKERTTFEIMDPQSIGLTGSTITLGKLSGRHAFKNRLQELGYSLSNEDIERAFENFKKLADKKRDITDRDLEALVNEELRVVPESYRLDLLQVMCGEPMVPTATVRLIDPNNHTISDTAQGTGPVDAAYKAINHLIQVPNELIEFSVNSVTEGIDAMGEVTARIRGGGKVYIGRGASTDIIVASAKAYINALNRLIAASGQMAES